MLSRRVLNPESPPPVSVWQHLARVTMGGVLAFAGVSHLTFAREEFQAQVPKSLPLEGDFVVLASGVTEIMLGGAFALLPARRVPIGWVLAAFFVAIFPGNVSQYLTRSDAFGLNSDRARLIRLLFQPLLVAAALWSSGAWAAYRDSD